MEGQEVDLKDVIGVAETAEFLQDLMSKYGDTPEKLMDLLLKVSVAKAILERALGVEKEIVVTLGEDE